MPPSPALLETQLEGLTLHRRGKVRDVYEVGDDLLIVATDRISAFDFVLGSGIPDKGKVLTQISAFWFETLADVVPNHVISVDADDYPEPARRHADVLARPLDAGAPDRAAPRRVRGARATCRARAGRTTRRTAPRLRHRPARRACSESDRLPSPIFTPATKAESGHDMNISEAEAGDDGRARRADRPAARPHPRALLARRAAHAEGRGIIVADTKFEFGAARRRGPRGPGVSSSSTRR